MSLLKLFKLDAGGLQPPGFSMVSNEVHRSIFKERLGRPRSRRQSIVKIRLPSILNYAIKTKFV